MITVVGIPVYYHYCGGELEEINYVLKSSSCCGGEEDDSQEANGCCKDENLILKSNIDFTIKDLNDYAFVKTFSQVFFISLPFSGSIQPQQPLLISASIESPPPRIQNDLIISTSVLRI